MKDLIKTMLEHPIASVVVIGAVGKTVAKIISCFTNKGQDKGISVTINTDDFKKSKKTEEQTTEEK
jgi:hypothetical protein